MSAVAPPSGNVSPAGSVRSGTHIPALDGVRGLAVLVVMLSHFAQYGGAEPTRLIDSLTLTILEAGWIGVDLFFVLSGFLITGILLDSKEHPGYYRNFIARRALRIFPLYYAVLLSFLVLLPAVFTSDHRLSALGRDEAWYWGYLLNWHIAGAGWPEFGALGHFWTLAVEEQFYFFWPLLVWMFSSKGLMRLCVAFIAGSLLLRLGLQWMDAHPHAAFVLTPARMDSLAAGGLVALIVRDPAVLGRVLRFAAPVACAAAFVLVAIFVSKGSLPETGFIMQTAGFTLLSTLFATVILLTVTASSGSRLNRGFTAKPLTTLGKYSYALYVFHHPLLFFLPASVSIAAVPSVLGSQLPGLVVFSLGAGLATFAVAWFSWHFYEKRFLALKRLFSPTPSREGEKTTAPAVRPAFR